ncbi:hypothetical protein Nepgr_028844 [Nepenthes gracilis]|uniref:Uncharacterized protein n=1 Tax=Nepenthes gracilis TaxID=150966 RepID=A0AAD3Y4Z1_NEPGR|nr:hypothetical protein Nepgr_028844 [Nepenthes gracilis]
MFLSISSGYSRRKPASPSRKERMQLGWGDSVCRSEASVGELSELCEVERLCYVGSIIFSSTKLNVGVMLCLVKLTFSRYQE